MGKPQLAFGLAIMVVILVLVAGCSGLRFRKDTLEPGMAGFARQIARKNCQAYKGDQYQDCLDRVEAYYREQKLQRELQEMHSDDNFQ